MDEVEKNKTVEKDMKKLVNKSWFRYWLSAEMSNSYERLQSLSFCYSIIPVLKKLYPNKEEFRKNAYKLFDKNLLYTPWNKLFESKYVMEHNLRFPTTFWDDFPFNVSVVREVERVTVTSKQYYHFLRARTESETAAYRPGMYEKREEEHGWMLNLYKEWHVGDAASIEMIARRYIERFIGCVENVTNPKCEMTEKEKRQEIKKMLANPRVAKMVKVAKPRSKYMKIMLLPIKWNSTFLTYLEAKVITHVKTKNTKLFTKLKVGR